MKHEPDRKHGIRSGPFHQRQRQHKAFVYLQLVEDPVFLAEVLPKGRLWDRILMQVVDLEGDSRKLSEGTGKWLGKGGHVICQWSGYDFGQQLNPTGDAVRHEEHKSLLSYWGKGKEAEIFIHPFPPVNGEVCALGIHSNSPALANYPVLFNHSPGQRRPCTQRCRNQWEEQSAGKLEETCSMCNIRLHLSHLTVLPLRAVPLEFSLQSDSTYSEILEMALFVSKWWWILMKLPLWFL